MKCNISTSENEYQFPAAFPLSSLIPSVDDLSNFYRYNGSLTTPGCYEAVLWTVFEETIKLSEDQVTYYYNSAKCQLF